MSSTLLKKLKVAVLSGLCGFVSVSGTSIAGGKTNGSQGGYKEPINNVSTNK